MTSVISVISKDLNNLHKMPKTGIKINSQKPNEHPIFANHKREPHAQKLQTFANTIVSIVEQADGCVYSPPDGPRAPHHHSPLVSITVAPNRQFRVATQHNTNATCTDTPTTSSKLNHLARVWLSTYMDTLTYGCVYNVALYSVVPVVCALTDGRIQCWYCRALYDEPEQSFK